MEKITLSTKSLFFILFTLVTSLSGLSQTYTTPGTTTYTVPAGVTSIVVEAWGAGGRGGGRSSNGSAGGGGGGAYARSILTVIPGATYNVNVGSGSASTAPGGDSWFDTAGVLMAKGGSSVADNNGTGANGGQANASVGTVRFNGGDGANRSGSNAGGGGSSAGFANAGTDATGLGGANAPAGGGNGGDGRNSSGNGYDGLNPGGGGGGARRQGGGYRSGGDGAAGQVIITVNMPEINIVGNSVNIVSGDVTPSLGDHTDFGFTDAATGIVNRTFTIQNTGSVSLSLGTMSFTGANANNFSIVTPPSATIAAGASTTFTLAFNPDAIGLRTATVSIVNNDSDEDPYTFALQGNGSDAEIEITGNGFVIINGDTTPHIMDFTDFGTAASGVETVPHTFIINNLATATTDLNIGAITITGANAGDFTVTTNPDAVVNANSSTSFVITFGPTGSGIRTAVISVANDDGDENPYTFTVVGISSAPDIEIFGNSTLIANGDTAPSLADWTNFGGAHVTGGTRTRTFTIVNPTSSTQPLLITSVTLGGDFTIITPPATTVPVGGQTTFTIQFDPTALGNRISNVRVYNNTSDKNPYLFTILGTGSNPEISVLGNGNDIADGDMAPSALDNTDFGTVSIDDGSVLVTYTIRNTGATAMYIGDITFSGPDAGSFSVVTPPASMVATNSTTTMEVSFAPTLTVGIKNAVISIENDDQNEDPFDFAITGLAVRTYPDTDGDGVSDNIDIDDDNDGILDIFEQENCVDSPIAQTAGHLYLNETFGAGTTRGKININIPGAMTNYCYEDGIVGPNMGACDFQNDWSVNDGEYTVNYSISAPAGDPGNTASWSSTNWTRQQDHTTGDVDGRMAIFNASYTPQVFYETTISGIMPNVPLTYSFWALNIMSQAQYGGTILPNITVQFVDLENDAIVSTFNTGNIGRCGTTTGDNTCAISQWREYTTSVNLGNVTSFLIRFINNATGGNGNDLALDDITIRQFYCDYDLDGVSNLFDLDSDNDGISDIEESGSKHLSDGRGTMDMSETVWRDENRNGLHDEIDELLSNGAYFLPDSDYDGIPDYLDLDSDNDSIFDVDEAGLLNGDGDVDGNGVGDGIDTDQDGFLDVWDTFDGHGTNVRPYANDSSGYDIPDYRNTDSDFDGTYDITGTLYEDLDVWGIGEIIGTDDIDRDGLLDIFDTDQAVMGSPRDFDLKLFLSLDGRNDYAEGPQLLGNLPQATIMGWLKLANPYTDDGFVLGQNNFNIKIDANGALSATAKNITISGTVNLDPDRWYHVAAIYNGSDPDEKLKLFVNGQQESFSNDGMLSGNLNASAAPFTIGKNATSSTEYFKGDVDEIRIFSTALTTDQLQKMVYQEIMPSGANIRGEIIPRDIEGSTWNSLLGYFRMDAYKNDVIDSYTTTTIDDGLNTNFFRIYYVKHIRYQLAPMPFITTLSAPIDVAVSQDNFVNGTDVMTYDWSILHIKHDIDFEFNQTDLGLFIDPAIQVNMIDDNVLRNTWYLKMDGNVDLKGKAQLVQTTNSDLDPTSAGIVERDQQGTTNRFNYNYWSSPVGLSNQTSNNNEFSIASVLKDGTDPDNILDLQWTTSLNSTATSPLTLSAYWLFKFQNVDNDYANWTSVGPNGLLTPGEGFTLKGSSALTENQNYTFVGKPNNGAIQIPISADNLNLTGNPYPSALDADAFITDNLTSTTGTLYIWEHFTTNDTHVLADYQGGYATRTLVGGTAPVSPADVSGLGSSTRVPGRFLPVGQGFFMTGSASGGQISFGNNQRAFVKEDNAESNPMFRATQPTAAVPTFNNYEDSYEEDTFGRIRLAYISPNNYHRQILLGFMDENATAGIDPGYDAVHIDAQPSDMCFKLGDAKLNIQGDGHFNQNNIYPLEVKSHMSGNVTIALESIVNFNESQPIYLHDAQTDIYHNLKSAPFTMALPAGTYNRFSLRFIESLLNVANNELIKGLSLAHSKSDENLHILNELEDISVLKVDLYNILGQHISSTLLEGEDQRHMMIPVEMLTSGTYIAKVTATNGIYTTKILIP